MVMFGCVTIRGAFSAIVPETRKTTVRLAPSSGTERAGTGILEGRHLVDRASPAADRPGPEALRAGEGDDLRGIVRRWCRREQPRGNDHERQRTGDAWDPSIHWHHLRPPSPVLPRPSRSDPSTQRQVGRADRGGCLRGDDHGPVEIDGRHVGSLAGGDGEDQRSPCRCPIDSRQTRPPPEPAAAFP